MKKILTLTIVFVLGSIVLTKAQNIPALLDSAQTAYAANNPQEARKNLQQALIDLNKLIGKKILMLMPPTIDGLDAKQTDDLVVGGTGFSGLMVSRTYGDSIDKEIEVTLANDSPMLSMVNSFLSNDILSGIMASQTGQKKVVVGGYKGMLTINVDDKGIASYTINIPVDDTLFTFVTNGFDNESEVLTISQKINLDKIMAMLK